MKRALFCVCVRFLFFCAFSLALSYTSIPLTLTWRVIIMPNQVRFNGHLLHSLCNWSDITSRVGLINLQRWSA